MALETIFNAVDKTDFTNPDWDYIEKENAVALFDVSKHLFGMVSRSIEIKEEASGTGGYRSTTYYTWYLYWKANAGQRTNPIETINADDHLIWNEKTREHEDVGMQDLLEKVKARLYGENLRKVASINSSLAKIYISQGNLVIERA